MQTMFKTDEIAARVAKMRGEQVYLLRFTGGCNNRCRFCPAAGRPPGRDVGELLQKLTAEAVPTSRRLVLAGAEPTVQPGFERLLGDAKAKGFQDFEIWTNARRFAYGSYARKIMQFGLSKAFVYMPAADERAYGLATGVPEGFSQALRGIDNLVGLVGLVGFGRGRCHLELLVPVLHENLDRLHEIGELALRHGARGVVLAPAGDPGIRPGEVDRKIDELRAAFHPRGISWTWAQAGM